MVFTSYAFVVFFLIVFVGLRLCPDKVLRQLLILVASIYFYAYWKPIYILILATPSIIDYICAIQIEDSQDVTVRRRWLLFSLISNLGLLGYFKYANFFIDNFSVLLGKNSQHL